MQRKIHRRPAAKGQQHGLLAGQIGPDHTAAETYQIAQLQSVQSECRCFICVGNAPNPSNRLHPAGMLRDQHAQGHCRWGVVPSALCCTVLYCTSWTVDKQL